MEQAWNLRQFLHTLSLLLILITGFLALYLGVVIRSREGWLFALLCFCVAGYTSYLLLDSFAGIPLFPWFTLEVLCSSGTLLLALLLQNRMCNTNRRAGRVSEGIAFLFCLISTGTVAFSGKLPLVILDGASVISTVISFGGALYLVITACIALLRRAQRATLLSGGSLFYAASLLWDRLLPLYEPIYGGWFPEWGGLMLCCAIGGKLWSNLAEAYRFRLTFSEQKRQMERQLALQQEHYQQLSRQIELARAASHDLRHNMRVLQEYADAGNYEGLQDYLRQYEPHLAQNEIRTLSSPLQRMRFCATMSWQPNLPVLNSSHGCICPRNWRFRMMSSVSSWGISWKMPWKPAPSKRRAAATFSCKAAHRMESWGSLSKTALPEKFILMASVFVPPSMRDTVSAPNRCTPLWSVTVGQRVLVMSFLVRP